MSTKFKHKLNLYYIYITSVNEYLNNNPMVLHAMQYCMFSKLTTFPQITQCSRPYVIFPNDYAPVYKGHSREPQNVPFMISCPLHTS